MAQPTLKYWSWWNVAPQFAALAALIALFWVLLPSRRVDEAFLLGAAFYVTYSFGSRYVLARSHRAGMRATSRKDFDTALEAFQKSYEFFSRHAWLDDYRALTMMSPSVWSYREMALMNIASVHVMRKDYAAATKACSKVLDEFPQNEIAKRTIDMIQSPSMEDEA